MTAYDQDRIAAIHELIASIERTREEQLERLAAARTQAETERKGALAAEPWDELWSALPGYSSTGELTGMMIRSGRHGERDAWALQSGCSGGGWAEVPDLTSYSTRDAVAQVVAETYKGASDSKIANFAGQLWALRGRIEAGDLMVMPMKTTRQIALGRVTGSYEYRAAHTWGGELVRLESRYDAEIAFNTAVFYPAIRELLQ